MKSPKILFHEEDYREPLDCRCVSRLLQAFPRVYSEVVEIVVKNSQNLTREAFKVNLALMMPSFGMTRNWAFRGIGFDKEGNLHDNSEGVIGLCWDKIENEVHSIRTSLDGNILNCERSRRFMKLSWSQRDDVIGKISGLMVRLCRIDLKSGQIHRVGASKVLFAALPEVALPVDNLEWKHVFKTDDYAEILKTMAGEIIEWEEKTGKHLDECDPHQPTTLPSVFNVLAMSIRPLEKMPPSETMKRYDAYLRKSEQTDV